MSRFSFVGQAGSVPNYNNLVHVCSVLKYVRWLGVASAFDPGADVAAADWAARYFALVVPGEEQVPVVPGSASGAECVMRAYGSPAAFPPVPSGAHVIDMVFRTEDASGQADETLSFYDGNPTEHFGTDIIAPLPREMIKSYRRRIPGRVCVFLGTDPLGRAQGIADIFAIGPTPLVMGTLTSAPSESANRTVHPVPLPGGVQPGELLLVLFANDDNSTITWPAGWTSILSAISGTAAKLSVAYRVATDSESEVQVSSSNATRSCARAFRIYGAGTPSISTAVTANSTAPDPPSLTVPSVSNHLWIAAEANGQSSYNTLATAYPASYVGGINARADDLNLASGWRIDLLNAQTENPGAFALQSGKLWVAATIAIPPLSSIYSSSVVSFPSAVTFWRDISEADVLIAGAGVPTISGQALGIPTITLTASAAEDDRYQRIIPLSLRGWEYLGYLPNMTDAQIAEAARQLMLFDRAKNYAMSAHGLLRGQEQGVRRVAEWVVRRFVGTSAKILPLQSYPLWPNRNYMPAPGKV